MKNETINTICVDTSNLLSLSKGIMLVNIDKNNEKLTNISNLSDNQDAVNKRYEEKDF